MENSIIFEVNERKLHVCLTASEKKKLNCIEMWSSSGYDWINLTKSTESHSIGSKRKHASFADEFILHVCTQLQL